MRLAVEDGPRGPAIAVADTGPGIPAAERERVLERFVRLDATRSTSGNGLGLSLVQAVARLHGARLLLGDNRPGPRGAPRVQPPAPGRGRATVRVGRLSPMRPAQQRADPAIPPRAAGGGALPASAKNARTARSSRRSGRQASDTVARSPAPSDADRAQARIAHQLLREHRADAEPGQHRLAHRLARAELERDPRRERRRASSPAAAAPGSPSPARAGSRAPPRARRARSGGAARRRARAARRRRSGPRTAPGCAAPGRARSG